MLNNSHQAQAITPELWPEPGQEWDREALAGLFADVVALQG